MITFKHDSVGQIRRSRNPTIPANISENIGGAMSGYAALTRPTRLQQETKVRECLNV
jgi:hypothetical protein